MTATPERSSTRMYAVATWTIPSAVVAVPFALWWLARTGPIGFGVAFVGLVVAAVVGGVRRPGLISGILGGAVIAVAVVVVLLALVILWVQFQ